MTRLDWTIVRTAATGGLILIVPGAFLAAQLFDGRRSDGDPSVVWAWLFLVVVVAGFAIAGFVAGRLRSDTPMLHGAVSAGLAFIVAQVFGIVVALSRGASVSWVAIPLTGLLAVSMGVAGSLIGDRLQRRSARMARSGA